MSAAVVMLFLDAANARPHKAQGLPKRSAVLERDPQAVGDTAAATREK